MSNNPLYNQLLDRVLIEQPELAPFAELFKQQDEHVPASEDTQKLKLRLRKVTAIAKGLKGNLDIALDKLDELAQALGACEACWGDDNRCPICKGEGQAGYFKPDQRLSEEILLPVLAKAPWLELKEKFKG